MMTILQALDVMLDTWFNYYIEVLLVGPLLFPTTIVEVRVTTLQVAASIGAMTPLLVRKTRVRPSKSYLEQFNKGDRF
jgi:hypothetical protein